MTRLLASSSRLDDTDRLDRLLHAVAQLPDSVTLDITGDGPARGRLEIVARAYGIEDRVRFVAATSPGSDAVVIDPTIAGWNMAEFLSSVTPGGEASVRRGDDAVLRGHRVALLTNRITHYRVPLWNSLARRLERAGGELRVFLTAGHGATSPWMVHEGVEFDHVALRSPGGPLRKLGPLDLERRLGELRPTLVVCGGLSPALTGRAAGYATRHHVPLGLWSGEIPWGRTGVSRARRAQRRWTTRRASFALTYGSAATDYLHGLRPEIPQVIVRNSSSVREPVTGGRGKAGPLRLLTVGQAIRRKGLDVVIEAVRRLDADAVHLVVAGGGDALDGLRAQARGMANVEVLGAVPSDQVGDLYAQADAFLFPTRFDVFGLVLVEALGVGLPTVVSDAAGATADLLVHGENGLRVTGHDPASWASAISELMQNPACQAPMGAAARRTIADRWSLEHSVDAWAAGLRLGALLAREQSRP